jgi:lipid A 4'-phosphatase
MADARATQATPVASPTVTERSTQRHQAFISPVQCAMGVGWGDAMLPEAIAGPEVTYTHARLRKAFWAGSSVVGALMAVVFLSHPELDLLVSEHLYTDSAGFAGQSLQWVKVSRAIFIIFFWSCAFIAILGLWITHHKSDRWMHLVKAQWIFVAVCLAAGPGIVANLALKDHWGRARPKHVLEFGGKKIFTAPLVPTNQCLRNCSFISGEAASVFAPFYAAAFVLPQWSALLVVAGTLSGIAAGMLRVAQGGHFLSDVIFAGVFMALTVALLHKLLLVMLPTNKSIRPSRTACEATELRTRNEVGTV